MSDVGQIGAHLARGPRRSRQLLAALIDAYMDLHGCTHHEARLALDEDYRVLEDAKVRHARLGEAAAELRRGFSEQP